MSLMQDRRMLSNDVALLGEWRAPDGVCLVFHADARFSLGVRGILYWLEAAGSVLNINHRTWYVRQSGDSASVVGEWRDEPHGETWMLGADGRYLTRFDSDPALYEGTYEATTTHISTWEYRGTWQALNGLISMTNLDGQTESGTYLVQSASLTVSLPSATTVYQRV